MNARVFNWLTAAGLIALAALCVAWEMWLAPQRPGGSWLVLKVLPLLPATLGVLRGRRYTHKWLTLLIIAYFIEGVVRAYTDNGLSARLGAAEIALALLIFASAIAFVRQSAAKLPTTTAG